ncbi:MAG: DUF1330 domain-containing protein [Dehalococcoidia bacterium]
MSSITPNAEQFRELAASAEEGPVVMLNLLKFKAGDGAQEYDAYGSAASKMVAEGGGRVLYIGRCDQVLIGDDSQAWDAIALVEYPSRGAFIEMVSRKDYQQAHTHREAGLERTVLLATTPQSRSSSKG